MSESAPTVLYDLKDLRERPELLAPPPVVLPFLAWAGRLTLLAWPEKAGKSTLVGQGAAALATGTPFLGQPTTRTNVLWFGLDEALGDTVRRFDGYGARDGIVVSAGRLAPGAMESTIADRKIGLVVVDTLTEFVAGVVDDPNSPVQWQPLLKELRGILQRTGAGAILLHHTNKRTGGYRDSSQIGAGVDVVVELKPSGTSRTLRPCHVRGRVTVTDFTIRFGGSRYELDSGELPLEMRVYRAVEVQPGISLRQLRAAVGGKARAVDSVLADLVKKRTIARPGAGQGGYYVVRPVQEAGPGIPGHTRDTVRDTVPEDELSPLGQMGSRSGHASGHASCVPTP